METISSSKESQTGKAKLYVFQEDWKEQSLGIPKISEQDEVSSFYLKLDKHQNSPTFLI